MSEKDKVPDGSVLTDDLSVPESSAPSSSYSDAMAALKRLERRRGSSYTLYPPGTTPFMPPGDCESGILPPAKVAPKKRKGRRFFDRAFGPVRSDADPKPEIVPRSLPVYDGDADFGRQMTIFTLCSTVGGAVLLVLAGAGIYMFRGEIFGSSVDKSAQTSDAGFHGGTTKVTLPEPVIRPLKSGRSVGMLLNGAKSVTVDDLIFDCKVNARICADVVSEVVKPEGHGWVTIDNGKSLTRVECKIAAPLCVDSNVVPRRLPEVKPSSGSGEDIYE